MNEISIPYHLAIPAVICLVGLAAIFFYRRILFFKNKLLWISVTVFLVLYLSIVAGAMYYDIYYQWDLNRYYLNEDGFFAGNEITKEQIAASQRLTSDVGRNFSFISGFIFAFVISLVIYICGKIFIRLKDHKYI